jgi:hypothetical protein
MGAEMSLSYRTMPTEQLARWHYPRNPDHYLIRPRVIEREPRPGDIHPLPQSDLRAFLGVVPIDYTYNLRFVELRPRVSEEIGHPYGFYRFKERMIVLYSVPAREWFFPLRLQHYAQGYLKSFRADAEITDMGVRVTWKQAKDLSLFRTPIKTGRKGPHPGSLHYVPFAPLLPMLGEGIRGTLRLCIVTPIVKTVFGLI